jgi:TM2 domain-containing membrane protein YozV
MSGYLKHILIISVLIPIKLFSQDIIQNQYSYALSLYNSEQYYDAVTEFKRLLFFDGEKEYVYDANEYIGMSYKMGGKFSDAILYFAIAEMNAGNDEELFNSKVEIVRANILRRTISHAIALLDSLQKDKRFTDKQWDIYYWKGWAYIFNDKWDDAAREFSKIDSSKTLMIFCKNVDQEQYSVSFANIISHFIPGAGQIYNGHYFSGFLSLGWNVLWGYLTINSFVNNRIFDGLVIGNLLWLRFYNGNLQNAVKYAEENNLGITNRALDYLQSGYLGIKP